MVSLAQIGLRATWCTFQPNLNKKKNALWKNVWYFQKNIFLVLWEIELSSPKIKKISCIPQGNFLSLKKKKKFLYFWKWNFLAPSLRNSYIFSKKKKFLFFRRELAKPKKTHLLWRNFLYSSKKDSSHILGRLLIEL